MAHSVEESAGGRYPPGPGFKPAPLRRGSSFDRFIPYRPGLDVDGAHHQLVQRFKSLSTGAATAKSSSAVPQPRANASANTNTRANAAITITTTTTTTGATTTTTATALAMASAASRDGSFDSGVDDSVFVSVAEGGGGARREYTRRLSAALDAGEGVRGADRILPFSYSGPPPSPALATFSHRYGSDSWLGSPKREAPGLGSTNRYTPPRHVRPEPDKVLLMSIRDDFYCSLMDWGSGNVIAVGLDTGAYVWNASTGKCKELMPCARGRRWGHRGHVTSVRWDPTGKFLAFGCSRGTVLIWDAVAMDVAQVMAVPKHAQVGCMAWHRHTLFGGTSSGRVYQLDTRCNTPQPTKCAPSHRRDVCSVELSPDESTLACGGDDGDVSIWEPRAVSVTGKIHAHKAGAKALAWCPWRRNILATGGGAVDGYIRLWSAGACALKAEVDTGMQVSSVLWSEEYRELVSAQGTPENSAITLWTARDSNLDLLTHLTPPKGRPLHLSLSPDGTRLASVSADDLLRLWNLFPRKRRPVESMSPLNLDRALR